MSADTPDQQITYPVGTDAADNPNAFLNMLNDVQQRLVREYVDVADRTARMLALVENQVSSLSTENRLDVYSGTNHVSLAARSHNNLLIRTTDSAAINNSVTLVSDAVLTAPIVPTGSSTYFIEFVLFFDCTTVADMKIALLVPAPTMLKWSPIGLAPGAITTSGDMKSEVITVSGGASSVAGIAAGIANTTIARGTGVLTTATAGNIVIQYAQQNLDASNLFVRTGSWLRVTRVS